MFYMTVKLQMPPGLEARVRDEAMREGLAADAIILRALAQVYPGAASTRKDDRVSARETKLLEKVGLGLTNDEWRRYWELKGRFEDGTLTAPEHAELLAVNERIERANAERVGNLLELADLRNVPLTKLGSGALWRDCPS